MKKASDDKDIVPDFKTLFESLPGLYLVLSPELKIIAASDAYLKATQTKRDDLIGKDILEVLPDTNPSTRKAGGNLRMSLNRVLQYKAPDAMAVQQYNIKKAEADGGGLEEKYWSQLNTPVLDRNDAILYIIHKAEDVTEFIRTRQKGTEQLKLTEELKTRTEEMEAEIYTRAQQLQEANQKLREAEKLKSEFFANVSHEFRTPLSLIIAPIESLLSYRKGEIPDSQIELLRIVHNNAIRLLQMVTGLLDFSKVEAGKMKVHREPTDISALTNSVLNDFESMMRSKKVELNSELKLTNKYVMIDRYLYERILFNLLSNATKFTPDGGSVFVQLSMSGDKLILNVEDNGIGIPQTQINGLFQMFHQLEGSSTRRFDGTGLGLAMVKEFAELLGGSVTVDSAVGKGSVFTVICQAPVTNAVPDRTYSVAQRAPLTPQFHPSEATAEERVEKKEGDMKVLVCEDNEELAAYIVSLLNTFCKTKIARDGEEGLKMVRTWQPDLVLTDVMMPKKDGIELCQAIKSDPKTSETIVVLLTALTHREALMKGWEAKADEYLFKPFHPKELTTRIRSLFSVITERKRASEIVEQKNTELVRTNSELEAFSYSVTHDLRAPLRIIAGFSRILLDEQADKLDKSGVQNLQVINDNVNRMDRLIDDLLNFSRTGRIEVKKETVDMSELVEDIISNIKPADKSYSTIKILNLPPAYCDPNLIKQVWSNLISNALKYSRTKDAPLIEIGAKEMKGQLTYYVKDNGVGFDMQYANKLFGVFQRMHTVSEFEGTGIGLALVQRIIRKHGGEVRADAKVGVGATFYFTLPEA